MIYQYPSSTVEFCMPLQSWDVFSISINNLLRLHQKESAFLLDYGTDHDWDLGNELKKLIESAHNQAIVLTNINQEILWVNDNFSHLTGYEMAEVLGLNPKFLQGQQSEQKAARQIKEHLKKGQSFTQNVLNYRKAGDAYLCCIKVYPLYNKDKELVNYIAFESEVKPDAA